MALVLGAAAPARADRGDRTLGIDLEGTYPGALRLAFSAQQGMNDWLVLRVDLGGAMLLEPPDAPQGEVLATFGALAAFDVFSWVPEVYVGGGPAISPRGVRGRIVAWGGVRTYLTFEMSLSLRAGLEWTPLDDARGVLGAGLAWTLD